MKTLPLTVAESVYQFAENDYSIVEIGSVHSYYLLVYGIPNKQTNLLIVHV